MFSYLDSSSVFFLNDYCLHANPVSSCYVDSYDTIPDPGIRNGLIQHINTVFVENPALLEQVV